MLKKLTNNENEAPTTRTRCYRSNYFARNLFISVLSGGTLKLTFELKTNPAPNSFAVLTWRETPDKKEIVSIVDFSGGDNAKAFATEYLELQTVLWKHDTNSISEWLFRALQRRR
jgi:hypothetical protein